jgi:alginate O-acetyltransferase complex protein AlgI
MLFTGLPFLAIFLPITLLGFFLLARLSLRAGLGFLLACSLVFYGWESPQHLGLLFGSVGFNFLIARRMEAAVGVRRTAFLWLCLGVILNLLVLAVFKYAGFFVENMNALAGTQWPRPGITLPIGISFFTFTQTAYLVDVYRHGPTRYDPIRYGLFVTYFPHLVAGPIIHHAQVMPQFLSEALRKPRGVLFALGAAIFALGLFKKIVLADGVAPIADTVFNASPGSIQSASDAWTGALAYTLQLYFDFSGYSDMAIGLSWIFGVRMPYNFNSPYKALSISDFWRRWHMTLSQFLRDYLYISLGGNRKGPVRRHINLLLTMVLGGFWHGASWTFVVWGALHGIYLVVNHLWRDAVTVRLPQAIASSLLYRVLCWAVTFLAVVHAWVFFRATSLNAAIGVLKGMWSMQWWAHSAVLAEAGLDLRRSVWLCAVLIACAALLPNTNSMGERLRSVLDARATVWSYVLGAALALIVLLGLVNALRGSVSPFIYFNF